MNYLVTGITGTLGTALLPHLLADPDSVILGISRDEQKQRLIQSAPGLTVRLGDVREIRAYRNYNLVFHLAALKCVDTLETQPEEAFKTNVEGTQNVYCNQLLENIPRVVLASTDKACYPINAYGNSKAMAERIIMGHRNNVVCRYGNVLGSRGSVLPMMIKSLRETGSVSITDRRMTRFWITIEDAAKFVYQSSKAQEGGLKIPKMKAAPVIDLARAVADVLGMTLFKTIDIGIRPGEKVHECLRMEHEGGEIFSNTAEQYTIEELKVMIRPYVAASIGA